MIACVIVIQKVEVSMSTSFCIPFFVPYLSGLICLYSSLLRSVSLSALSSLLSISFFVLCIRVSFSCYILLAVYSRYCFAFDGVSSRGAVGK